MAPLRGRRKKDYDVVVQGQSAEKVASEIAAHLTAKGFCTVDPRLDDDLLRQGREDISQADAQGALKQPPAMVHDGLLGEEGSSLILDLFQEGLISSKSREFRHLMALDESMSELVNVLQLSMGQLSFGSLSKTHGLVHETGLAPEHAPDPTEHEASYWLGTLAQKKIMILLCLGPVRGTLELQPYDEDTEAYEVPTIPGSFIILRADAMWHRHCAHSKAHILSCFLVGHEGGRKGAPNWVPPCAKSLEQWTVERMKILKENQAKTQERLDLPAGWITAMNHMFHTAQRVAVRSVAARYAGSWQVQSWYMSQPSGPDLVTEVPLTRWDVDTYFDAEESEWRRGKSMARHGSFVEGTEYFDNKFFGLSPLEAKGMDPHQRVVLEVGYEACHYAGYSKGKLMNKIGGVYLGSSSTVFGMVSEVSGATGGAASINSNRFSFCLGLKGPSMTCDTDGSSSLTAVHLGGEAVLTKGHGVSNEFSLAGGVAFQLGPVYLPQMQAAGLLGGLGRCFTWDVSAQGYTLGDGCGFIVQKRMADWVDGRQVLIEGEPLVASICGSSCATIGMGAAMNAPHGPSEQELVAQTLKTAMLDPLNIDAVECNGQGSLLRDAVEADSLLRVLRNDLIEAPLPLTAVKSRMGYATECAGIASLHRLLLSGVYGVLSPNNHLHQLNPHLSFDNRGALLTEPLETAMASSYMGVQSHGFGGTQVHVIAYGMLEQSRTAPPPVAVEQKQNVFNFWPGGGGELEEDQQPSRGYFIAGTWTKWRAIKMENEGGDNFGYTMTLGENRWEEFQIYLDGDEKRRLHPEAPRASKGVPVQGPDEKARGLNWRIEGRGQWMDLPSEAAAFSLGNAQKTSKAIQAISSSISGTKHAIPSAESQPLEFGSGDVGVPGDKYRIRLRIAGRYRTVLWEKLPTEDHDTSYEAPEGDYFITGSWNQWAADHMSLRNESWSIEVELPCHGGEFQLLRNEDWGQVIAPGRRKAAQREPGQGPDHCGKSRGCTWFLDGRPGDVFRITFKREMIRQSNGKLEDEKKVSWEKVREAKRGSEELAKSSRLGVVGSWNGFGKVHRMHSFEADGQTVYNFLVEVGRQGFESFQLVQDFDLSRILHPDRPVTVPGPVGRVLVSQMDEVRQDLVWALGVEKPSSTGDLYRVDVVARGEVLLNVSWQQLEETVSGKEVFSHI
ncbi:Phenolphthiocerol/phthiocerol polyketide synthase subunit A ((Phenol)carboxyphthiodiolenone synthase subunit A) (Beta-ketoacyl-acyl-carrier-protein synthase I) (Phthiocerol synthesis polyketide synthase type I PpsA) [Durusdinium trenchii]|uniref:Ketosynthase family 3 (KS3) domain-containing protein n=1 Tax=Durusdinium trenchii TaxID=1381693 RepID=A0ABP0PVM1_9DINO